MTAADPYAALRTDLTGMPPLDTMGAAFHEPAAADRRAGLPPQREPAPPGMAYVLTTNGQTQLGYLPPGYEKTPDTPPSAPTEPDKWPKRLLSGGGAASMFMGVVGHYGPGINQAGHGLESAGMGIALTAAGVGGAALIVKALVTSKRTSGVSVSVTVNPTINATSTSTSRSRSRSR